MSVTEIFSGLKAILTIYNKIKKTIKNICFIKNISIFVGNNM